MSAAGQIFAPCKICIRAILGVRAAAKPPWMGLRRSSTGIPHILRSAKMLKLGITEVMLAFTAFRLECASKACHPWPWIPPIPGGMTRFSLSWRLEG
ncbi:hypothetical protein EQU24_20780 [Methylotuvimicrobium buryatense]|uniref:Uncharacterized protein n=1 Tax=Methylotuvimicrobium buryatense TaxID=95641 RepID=A0A4V1IKC2_METBY|nr:hypothetical protein EQU24_20780 [Methylotuvimicrobium buryatense]